MDIMQVGNNAPDFNLKNQDGKDVNFSDLRGNQPVVLIFYPVDETPGCTKQLCAARDDNQMYMDAGVAVFGINPGDAESHRNFINNHNLTMPLLVDEGLQTATAYDALMEHEGKQYVRRTVVGIDRDGRVAFYQRGMPDTQTILAAFQQA